jgi:hypothetical protein
MNKKSWVPLFPENNGTYILAYKYGEYMKENPTGRHEALNPYYQSLLANQPEPSPDDQDAKSIAIRYAKKHYECFYTLKDINYINSMIERGQITQ